MCVMGAINTIPLYKTATRESDKVRPVGVEHVVVRHLHQQVALHNKSALADHLEPVQLWLSKAGAQKLVHSVRMFSEMHPEFIVVKLDLKNAHSEISRAAVVEELEAIPSLRHLAFHTAITNACHTTLVSGGRAWGVAGDGMVQGDPEAGGRFTVGIHRDLLQLDSDLSEVGGGARGGQDDIFAIGPAHVVFEAVDRFAIRLWRRCGLQLQRDKTEVFSWGDLPPETPPEMKRGGGIVGGVFRPGILIYGIPFGHDDWVRDQLKVKVDEIKEISDGASNLLENDRQALWTLLSSSITSMLDFHAQLCYPSDMT